MTNPITGDLLSALDLLKFKAENTPDFIPGFSKASDFCDAQGFKNYTASVTESALANYNPERLEQVRRVQLKVADMKKEWETCQGEYPRETMLELFQLYEAIDPEIKAWALGEGE